MAVPNVLICECNEQISSVHASFLIHFIDQVYH